MNSMRDITDAERAVYWTEKLQAEKEAHARTYGALHAARSRLNRIDEIVDNPCSECPRDCDEECPAIRRARAALRR